MMDFQLGRWLLAGLLLSVSILTWRSNAPGMFAWFTYTYFTVAVNTIPAHPYEAAMRNVMSLCEFGLLLLLVWSVVDAYSFLGPHLTRADGRWLALFGVLLGSVFAFVPYAAHDGPLNRYVAGECALLALAVAHSACWCFVRWIHPVESQPALPAHGLLLCGWLWVLFLRSTAARGCLLWNFFEWHDGYQVWRVHSDLVLVAQIGLAVGWIAALKGIRCSSTIAA